MKKTLALPAVTAALTAITLTLSAPTRASLEPPPDTTPSAPTSAPVAPPVPSPLPADTVPAPIVRAVSVTGNRELTAPTISDVAAKAAFGKPGDPTTIRAAVAAVVALYRQKGYPVAQVINTDVSPEGVLTITVAEGTVRRVIIRGNSHTRAGIIRKVLETKPGSIYQEERVKNDRNRLARLGIFADVVIAPVVPGSVSEKEALKTPIKGDKKGNDSPINTDTAPPIDASKGTEEVKPVESAPPAPVPPSGDAAQKAAETPILPDVPAPGVDEDVIGQVDVIVKVKEDRTGNVAATVGYGDHTGLIGFVDLTEDNLAGSAQRVAFQWQRSGNDYVDSSGLTFPTQSRSAFDLSFEQPTLAPNSFSYGVDLYNKETVFQPFFTGSTDTIRNYELRRGGIVRFGRMYSPGNSAIVSLRHDRIGYDPVPDYLNPPLNYQADNSSTVAAVGINLVFDRRNEIDNPHAGYLNSLVYEQAGTLLGGNRTFGQTRLDLRRYVALKPGKASPIIAMRLLGGVSTGGEVPLAEQFFIGGYDLLRGYDLYSIYGKDLALGSAELRFPLSDGVQGVVFSDTGDAFSAAHAFSLKTGAGIGLRFLSPVGPIRVDIAHGSTTQTYVSLGQSF